MDDVIQTFFEQLSTHGYTPLLHEISGTYRFDIEGKGSWGVVVKDGVVTVTREMLKADCTLTCDQETFARIIRGEQNSTTAFMQGKLKITGDLSLAQMFQRLFRIRPETTVMSTRG
jgi:putative sterol carrier protein